MLADGRVLEYFEFGAANGSALLLLHGSLSSGKHWAFLHYTALAEGWRLVCPSLPGWGLSTPGDATAAAWRADVRALMAALHIDRFTVAGTSFVRTRARSHASSFTRELVHTRQS